MCDICGDGPAVLVCLACDDEYPDLPRLMGHIQNMHPDDYPDVWPDGELVYFGDEL